MAMEISRDYSWNLAIPHLAFWYKVFDDFYGVNGDVKRTYGSRSMVIGWLKFIPHRFMGHIIHRPGCIVFALSKLFWLDQLSIRSHYFQR